MGSVIESAFRPQLVASYRFYRVKQTKIHFRNKTQVYFKRFSLMCDEALKFEHEPVREKTNNLGFRPGLTQIGLYSHRRWLEAENFGFKKKRDCTIHEAKTKALISFAVTAKLICVFVFAYANCCFSHAQAHIFTYSTYSLYFPNCLWSFNSIFIAG